MIREQAKSCSRICINYILNCSSCQTAHRSSFDTCRPSGGVGAEGFRKIAGGAVTNGCNPLIKRDRRFGGNDVERAKWQIKTVA